MSAPSTTTAPLTKRKQYTVFAGLMIGILLAMLDNMILGTALPTIVGDLGGLNHFAWVVTAYTLASAVSTPIWGKLSDLYGRKSMFMASIVLFLIGSALAGTSGSMTELIVYRAVQGLGAGGLMVGAMAIMAEMVPPRERGKVQGMFAAIMPVAMVGGPFLGGFITDYLDWRWAFYVNLPLGIAALLVVGATLHMPKRTRKAVIDYWGAGLLTVGISSLVLLATWGGTEYAWDSWQIIGLGVLTVTALAAFAWVENRVAEPILPLRLFRIRNFSLASALAFVSGFAMFGAVSFLPQYQQIVQGASATNSGLLLLPMMAGLLVCSTLAGQLTSRTGHYRTFPIIGMGVMAVGTLLLTQLDLTTSSFTSSMYIIVIGAGLGLLMGTTNLIAQNSVELRDLGVATSTATFARNIGGSLGVAVLGSIFTSRITDSMTGALGSAGSRLTSAGGQLSPDMIEGLPAPVRDAYLGGMVSGIQSIFVVATVFIAIGFVVSWFVKSEPLRDFTVASSSTEDGAAKPVPALAD
ncbi:MDR family MFS transporter [Kibdelosporangium persicum]|uniref:Multidrug resistance protein 3 n=1 Tax=Kibdelosporangium persicum TaxID=2698649 RepID=A0ABX2FAE7_9PSEU|nr:MDR family MFS transporter [Kibdelosporangium persicum]NRN68292.1 Multidrug resistance protein 3 [Kibdelosporangium persicum]